MFVVYSFEELDLKYIDEEKYPVTIECSDRDSIEEISLINVDYDAINRQRFNESYSSFLANRTLLIRVDRLSKKINYVNF